MLRIIAVLLTLISLLPLSLILKPALDLNQIPINYYRYLQTTVLLVLGVGFISFVIGTFSAAIVSFFTFPGRKIIRALLLLPLAIPSHITSFVYSYSLEHSSNLQLFLKSKFGCFIFPEMRSISGAIIILSLSLYPYVYMIAQAAFSNLGDSMLVSKTFNKSAYSSITSVAIPIVAPTIIGSVILVMMEVLSDFGSLYYLDIDTLATGVYRSWLFSNDHSQAGFFVAIIIGFSTLLVSLSKVACKTTKDITVSCNENCQLWAMNKKTSFIVMLTFGLILFFAFIMPTSVLIYWSLTSKSSFFATTDVFFRTITLCVYSSFAATIFGLLICYLVYISKIFSIPLKILSLHYSIPGVVYSIGILIFFGLISKYVNTFLIYLGYEGNFMILGTAYSLIVAYLMRFTAIPLKAFSEEFKRIPQEIGWVLETFGKNSFYNFVYINLPIIRKSFFTAFLLVFIDTGKELAITLILRPFGFNTISSRIFELVAEERYREAAAPSLILISLTTAALVMLYKKLFRSKSD